MGTVGFDDLFVDEYPKLVALGVSMCADREVARELAQETMIRAHGRWEVLEQYDDPRAWLRRVMSNLLIDHHRSRTAERSALERLGDAAPTTDEVPSPRSPWAALIAPLTPQQKIVATLFYADDMSVAEIARILDISAGGVKSTLSKVRRRLRRHHDTGGAS